jgi:DNA-binding FadR family transcriptional regulator
LPPESLAARHQGWRVLGGQVVLQAAHDPMLGCTEIDGRHYYVRQMKNMKGAIPMAYLSGDAFNFFVFIFGAMLARAHARSGDAAVIGGYIGTSTALDRALADWAEAYGEQTLKDHAALVKAIKSGRVEAVREEQ